MVRSDIWSGVFLVCVLVGCSNSRSSESLIEETMPLASSPDAAPSSAVQSPPPDAPTVPPATTRTASEDYRRTVAAQTDFTGLRWDGTVQERPQSTRPHHDELQSQRNDASEAPVATPKTTAAHEHDADPDQLSSPTSAASDRWHQLLQAPATQGEPLLPIEPLDLEEQRIALDALVLPEGDPRAAVIGCWRQVDSAKNSDFGNGGYTQSFLFFRTDGLLDLVRVYGTDGTIRLIKRYDYVIASKRVVSLGLSEEYRPRFPNRAQRIPGKDGETIVIAPPTLALPCKLKYSASGDVLELHGKTYERVSLPSSPNEDSNH